MSSVPAAIGQIAVLAILLIVTVPFVGKYLAHIYTSEKHWRVERWTYKLMRVDGDADQHWRSYAMSVLGFSLIGILFLYAFARLQHFFPLSLGFSGFPAAGAFNTAVSFVTNTNWQWYAGESSAGHLFQMAGLAVQNFLSAAVGLAVAAAFARALARSRAGGRIGNFWSDMIRTTFRVLIPMSFVGALVLIAFGAIQNFHGVHDLTTLTGGTQHLTGGPVGSQEAIKQIGTNGGGFFNANSAHPFENPTPFTNLLQIYWELILPFGIAWAFGLIVKDKRQGGAIVATMAALFSMGVALTTWAEMAHPGLAPMLAGGALEGKEVRFGEAGSALFSAATTATSTGAVNSMHDSFTAAGGGVQLFNMMLGEISPGGVGSGLYGMLMLAVVTVFLCGLMVGRTPEYLGKKIGQREIILPALYILATPLLILIGDAIAITAKDGLAGMLNTGPHGFSEVLYAVTSAGNNNGSAFAGLTVNTPFWNTLLGLIMLFGRFLPMIFVLALAGRFASTKTLPPSAGTLPTHKPLFVALLGSVAIVVVGLTYVPALVLGPIAEALS